MIPLVVGATAYAAPIQPSPTVTFGKGLPQEIELCFRGVPKEPLTYLGDKVFDWKYKLPVTLTVTNVVKGHQSSKRIYSFNLSQAGRTIRTTAYKIEIVWGGKPCVVVEVTNPFVNGDNARRTGQLKLRIVSDGQLLGQASYRYIVVVQGRRQIWQGTDAFVNYCIGEGKRIWSSGGKLYCWTEPQDDITVKRVA
jgi:hypothetical protein